MPDMDLGDVLIDDKRWTETVTHRPKSEPTNESGYAVESDGTEKQIDVIVRPESARVWKRLPEGVENTAEWAMIVKEKHDVSTGDEIKYRDTWYTVGDLESATSVDNYELFILMYE